MAARRLLIVMLALLALSTLAAALVPPQARRAEETTGTETGRESRPTRDGRGAPGRLVRRTIDAGRGRRPIRLRSGDQLALTVRSDVADQVEVPAFGLIEDVGRDDPARFDLLADRVGRFDIRLVEARRAIATISVRRPD
jgi:hypothetical protein